MHRFPRPPGYVSSQEAERPSWLSDSDTDRFADPFAATPNRRSDASAQESETEQPPVTTEEQEQVTEAEEQLAIADDDEQESDSDRRRIITKSS